MYNKTTKSANIRPRQYARLFKTLWEIEIEERIPYSDIVVINCDENKLCQASNNSLEFERGQNE